MFSTADARAILKNDNLERQVALEYIAEAWNGAEADGVDSEALSHAALFAALATLVTLYGEDTTAKLISDLPERIAQGEYSIDLSIQ